MSILWTNINSPMTETEANVWKKARSKGKFRWVLRNSVISLLLASALYAVAWALGNGIDVFWIFIWVGSDVFKSLVLWSDGEDRYSAYSVATILGESIDSFSRS